MYRRHRSGAPPTQDSSSDEEDAFTALSRKRPKQQRSSDASAASNASSASRPLPAATTSSMKRHHGAPSDSHKAKMDALLKELEAEKLQAREPVPDHSKKGWFVEPHEEHSTTNIFVRNLAPDISEQAVYQVFGQFGPLHSVKIMWPRNDEERARGRNSGFVCYRKRLDAEAAMSALHETDAFGVGRSIIMHWGKSVVDVAPALEPDTEKQYATGRQLEQRNRQQLIEGTARLSPEQEAEAHRLFYQQLCAEREAIAAAMAFCYEHGAAAKQIAGILKDMMLDTKASMETRIARLYLLSDVLFNSQQPGVRNAFMYRTAIEDMAAQVFTSLGQDAEGRHGRLTRNKLTTAVRQVLAAWADWDVYHKPFLDGLWRCYEGREPADEVEEPEESEATNTEETQAADVAEEALEEEPVRLGAQGQWLAVDESTPKASSQGVKLAAEDSEQTNTAADPDDDADGEPVEMDHDEPIEAAAVKTQHAEDDAESNGDDVDGEPLTEDIGDAPPRTADSDAERVASKDDEDDEDGEPLDDSDARSIAEVDGSPLDEDEVDGEPL